MIFLLLFHLLCYVDLYNLLPFINFGFDLFCFSRSLRCIIRLFICYLLWSASLFLQRFLIMLLPLYFVFLFSLLSRNFQISFFISVTDFFHSEPCYSVFMSLSNFCSFNCYKFLVLFHCGQINALHYMIVCFFF